MNNNHDVYALVSLATDHASLWGDSCHHALAEEILRLQRRILDLSNEVVRLRNLIKKNQSLDVDRIREEGRLAEVLHTIVQEAKTTL